MIEKLIESKFVELSIFDDDAARVAAWRQKLDKRGCYGRVTVHEATLENLLLPPYFAHHIFVSPRQSLALQNSQDSLKRLYESVRPYGGRLCLLNSSEASVLTHVQSLGLAKAKVQAGDGCVIVQREGSLPGSGTWTHQYGNIGNTIKSEDQLVKLPLGVLWYGGVSHEDVLPRHGHGPPEQVVGGRLFIEGINTLTARDVYTGRVLWQRKFADLGTHDVYFDDSYKETPLDPSYNQNHIPVLTDVDQLCGH